MRVGAKRHVTARTCPHAPLTRELRVLLALFAALALVAGFLLFPLAAETDRFFSWTIKPPLTAAFLGAAYWAAFVLFGWAARQATWEQAAPALVPVSRDRGPAAGRDADPPRQVRPGLAVRLVLAGRLLPGAAGCSPCSLWRQARRRRPVPGAAGDARSRRRCAARCCCRRS